MILKVKDENGQFKEVVLKGLKGDKGDRGEDGTVLQQKEIDDIKTSLDNKANTTFIDIIESKDDSSTDDTIIQKAFNNITNKINKVIINKECNITKPIEITKNCFIEGVGVINLTDKSSKSVIECNNIDYIVVDGLNINADVIREYDKNDGVINIKNVKNVILKNLTITGNILLNSNYGMSGIYVENCDNLIIENCYIKNVRTGIALNKVKKYTIRDNNLITDKQTAFWTPTYTNMFYAITIYNQLDNTNANISECIINNNGDICNNYFENWDITVSCRNVNSGSVSSNTILNSCFPITIDRCNGMVVNNNNIDNSNIKATNINPAVELVATSNTIVSNNYFISKDNIGICIGVYGDDTIKWYNAPTHNNIHSNIIKNFNVGIAVTENATNTMVNNNEIDSCNEGVRLNLDNINNSVISENHISNSTYYGISFSDTYEGIIDNIEIKNNSINNSKISGIFGNANNEGKSNILIQGNNLYNNTCEIKGKLSNATLINNSLTAQTKSNYCVVLDDTSGTITMISNKLVGVVTMKTGLTIKDYKNTIDGGVGNVGNPTVIQLKECTWIS